MFPLLCATVLIASCQSIVAPSPSTGCVTAARNYNGQVVAFTVTTFGVVRNYSAVRDDPRLTGVSLDAPAYVCYIDGQIGKAPPPLPNATPWPPYDRVVVVAVGNTSDLVTAGYRQSLPCPLAPQARDINQRRPRM
jgi:hypothetical protein